MIQIDEKLKNLIENNALALATVDENNEPHCIAVAFAKVVSQNQILITDNYMQTTVENIKRGSKVALVVWNKDWEQNCTGYALKGKAEYFTSGKWYEMVKAMPENANEPCKGAILITVEKIKKLA